MVHKILNVRAMAGVDRNSGLVVNIQLIYKSAVFRMMQIFSNTKATVFHLPQLAGVTFSEVPTP